MVYHIKEEDIQLIAHIFPYQTISAFYVLNHRIHCVRFLYFFPLILFLFNVSLVNQFQLSLEK